jgi:general secretion pathway protein F
VLERLADYTESRQQLRQRVSHALIYPVILTVLAVLIVGGLLVYVVPKVVGVFENTGQALPPFTRALIATSDFLRDYGLVLVALIGVGCSSSPGCCAGWISAVDGTGCCCACRWWVASRVA